MLMMKNGKYRIELILFMYITIIDWKLIVYWDYLEILLIYPFLSVPRDKCGHYCREVMLNYINSVGKNKYLGIEVGNSHDLHDGAKILQDII